MRWRPDKNRCWQCPHVRKKCEELAFRNMMLLCRLAEDHSATTVGARRLAGRASCQALAFVFLANPITCTQRALQHAPAAQTCLGCGGPPVWQRWQTLASQHNWHASAEKLALATSNAGATGPGSLTLQEKAVHHDLTASKPARQDRNES